MQKQALRYRNFSSLQLEKLEDRLPPGDVLMSVLLGSWGAPADPLSAESSRNLRTSDIDSTEIATKSSERATRRVDMEAGPTDQIGLGEATISISSAPIDDTNVQHNFKRFTTATFGQLTSRHVPPTTPVTAPGTVGNVSGSIRNQTSRLERELPMPSAPNQPMSTPRPQQVPDYGRVPLSFEANHGQTDARVDFVARTQDYTAFLTPNKAIFNLHGLEARAEAPGAPTPGASIHMEILGGNPIAQAVGQDKLVGIVNYFMGNDPSQWRTNVPTFGQVEYPEVYPGIDLVYYGKDRQLEYDFVVAPGADPDAVKLSFAGADAIDVDARGNLVLHTEVGDLSQQKPYLYQEIAGARQEVAGSFVLTADKVSFDVGAYDPNYALVIDPLVLGYSTYLGGADGDGGIALAIDSAGNAYAAGLAESGFPVTPGSFDPTAPGGYLDAFVAKINPTGTALIYSTYLGGTEGDYPFDLKVDGAGHVYVVGASDSPDFPTTAGAFDTTANGELDSFVTKLSPDGSSLVYSTLIGGAEKEECYGIAIDAGGNAYVTAESESADHPVTPGAYDETFNGEADVAVSKLNPTGSALIYSTYIGGAEEEEGWRVELDSAGNAYLVGPSHSSDYPTTAGAFDETFNGEIDAYVTKLNPTGSALIYSTYLGGSAKDRGYGLAVDPAGNVYVAGSAISTDFPTTAGAFDTTHNGGNNDAYVAKLNAAGSALIYSTYVGGSGADAAHMLALDAGGHAYITGPSSSMNYPTSPGTYDATRNGAVDVVVTKLSPDGSAIVFSTYIGGRGNDYGNAVVTDGAGTIYVTGYVSSGNFPTTPGVIKPRGRGEGDAFVAKFIET